MAMRDFGVQRAELSPALVSIRRRGL